MDTLAGTCAAGTVAYFSMEVGIHPEYPTYSGGLGILAGDTLRSGADLRVPMVGVTLVHREGYFKQTLDDQGNQREAPEVWRPEDAFEEMPARVQIEMEGRAVHVRAFRHVVAGETGGRLPIYFLDTDLPENHPADRTLTHRLYSGDHHHRLRQEVVLGLGGVEILARLGIAQPVHYHMNEGHSALLALALLARRTGERGLAAATAEDYDWIRSQCVFTTHTPVPAGHDQFGSDLVHRVLGPARAAALRAADCLLEGVLNMTYLALRFSRYVNGVSLRHGEVSGGMFPRYPINAITNGVHATTWTCPSIQELFDRRIAGWRRDNNYLRYAMEIPLTEIRQAHAQAKKALLDAVESRSGVRLSDSALTIGFARRAAPYKRTDFLFSDIERLKSIARRMGPIQVVLAGKAHPADESGKGRIRRVFEAARALSGVVPVVYLEDYEMALGRTLCAGVDLWLNNPLRPQEASGTSGMKAALNGVPSLSVLDGWWIEGHVEGVTGWSIEDRHRPRGDESGELASLYEKLEEIILPLFYGRPPAYTEVMRSAIALNGSFFNTQRMLAQYVTNAYFPHKAERPPG